MHLPISDYISFSLLSRFSTYFLFLIILLKGASLHIPARSLPQPVVQMACWAFLVLLSVHLSQRKPIPWSNAPGYRLIVKEPLNSFHTSLLSCCPTQFLPILFCHPLAFLSCVFTDLYLLISYQLLKLSTSLPLHPCLSGYLQLFQFSASLRTIRCIPYCCIPVHLRC